MILPSLYIESFCHASYYQNLANAKIMQYFFKRLLVDIEMLNAILVRTQKEQGRAVVDVLIILENTYVIMNRMSE